MTASPAAPWKGVFVVTDTAGAVVDSASLPLVQLDEKSFRVDGSLRYLGATGLDPQLDDVVRVLPFEPGRTTDLTSVPSVFRWFIAAHGRHTPAALFHDWLIDANSPITEIEADLLFRSMLQALGVPRFKRYILWTAVAIRTRWESSLKNKLLIGLWALLSLAGITLFALGLFDVAFATSRVDRIPLMIVAGLAPLPAAFLWGRQWPAALIAAVASLWAMPVAVVAWFGTLVYQLCEGAASLVSS